MKSTSILLLSLLTALPIHAGVIYVDFDRGSRGVTGRSWNASFKYLSDALASAIPGDEIWVTGGIHYPGTNTARGRADTFQLRSFVTVRGGYTLGQTSPVPQNLEPTILSGDIGVPGDISDNCYHVVTGTGAGGSLNGSPTVLENVTITGGNADGTDPNANADRRDVGGGLICDDAPGTSPILRNVIITGNRASRLGGGAFLNRCSPVFEQVTFSNNESTGASSGPSSGEGGAIFANLTAGRLDQCTFLGNRAASRGGAISNHGSTQDISGCTFLENDVESQGGAFYESQGGAIYNTVSSAPTITDCLFSGNRSYLGGAVCNRDSSTPSFVQCEFVRNLAEDDVFDIFGTGGAVSNESSAPSFRDCSFTMNEAYSGGALAYSNANATVSVINCSFDRNIAYKGGAISIRSVPSSALHLIRYSTFHANRAEFGGFGGFGGAIDCFSCPLLLQNSSFQHNTADSGGGLYAHGEAGPNVNNCAFWDNVSENESSANQSVYDEATGSIYRYCLIEGKSAASLDGLNASSFSNFDGTNPANNPRFALYGDYGGPTKTLPPLPGSFAIDPPGGLTANSSFDQRGFPSPVGAGGIFDIGAVEIQDEADLFRIWFFHDDDEDGPCNGLELAMGTDPNVNDPTQPKGPRIYYVGDGDFIGRGYWLDFSVGPRANELSLRLMKSTDLENFEQVMSNFNEDTRGISFKIPEPPGGKVFYRLEASPPPYP